MNFLRQHSTNRTKYDLRDSDSGELNRRENNYRNYSNEPYHLRKRESNTKYYNNSNETRNYKQQSSSDYSRRNNSSSEYRDFQDKSIYTNYQKNTNSKNTQNLNRSVRLL